MNKLLKLRFLLATSAVVALAPVAPALAASCETACTCSVSCDMPCTHAQGVWITCGRYGGDCINLCYGFGDEEPVAQDEAQQQDDTSARVCSEEHQDAELAASIES